MPPLIDDDELDLSPSTVEPPAFEPPAPPNWGPKFDPNMDLNLHPEEACS